MQATVWVSDTSTVCKTSGGVDGSMALAVTAGGRVGSMSESVSFDSSVASSVAGTNEGGTGGGSVTVSGADFGTSRWFLIFCGLGLVVGARMCRDACCWCEAEP